MSKKIPWYIETLVDYINDIEYQLSGGKYVSPLVVIGAYVFLMFLGGVIPFAVITVVGGFILSGIIGDSIWMLAWPLGCLAIWFGLMFLIPLLYIKIRRDYRDNIISITQDQTEYNPTSYITVVLTVSLEIFLLYILLYVIIMMVT